MKPLRDSTLFDLVLLALWFRDTYNDENPKSRCSSTWTTMDNIVRVITRIGVNDGKLTFAPDVKDLRFQQILLNNCRFLRKGEKNVLREKEMDKRIIIRPPAGKVKVESMFRLVHDARLYITKRGQLTASVCYGNGFYPWFTYAKYINTYLLLKDEMTAAGGFYRVLERRNQLADTETYLEATGQLKYIRG